MFDGCGVRVGMVFVGVCFVIEMCVLLCGSDMNMLFMLYCFELMIFDVDLDLLLFGYDDLVDLFVFDGLL